MATGHKKGLIAETLAGLYLMLKGYRLLARRYKTRLGEIDLVAKRGGTIIFVEVKLRKTARDGAEAIHAHNQARVRDAAALYLQKHPAYNDCDMRFDAVILSKGKWPRHLTNAF